MNAELRRDPGTEGPLFSRDHMLRHKIHEVETEMSKKLYDQHVPFPPTKYTHHHHHHYTDPVYYRRENGHPNIQHILPESRIQKGRKR